jgi:hypothetical protein
MQEKTMMVSKLSPGVRQFNLLEHNKNKKNLQVGDKQPSSASEAPLAAQLVEFRCSVGPRGQRRRSPPSKSRNLAPELGVA